MIQLIEAPPGSGKSYFAVNHLIQFTKFDDLYQEYNLQGNVLIISNIEGLKIKHWDLNASLATKVQDLENRKAVNNLEYKHWGISDAAKLQVLEDFFSIENFEQIMEKTGKNHVILCIDEAHDYFPSGFMSNKIYSFFAYHRHIGLDIVLMCQSLDRTSRMFNPLLEYVVRAAPRSRAIFNNFSYSFCDLRGRFLYSKTLQHRQIVFKAYTSFRQDEKTKPKNAVKHWVIITCVFLLISGLCFKSALAIVKGKSESAAKKQVKTGVTPDTSIKPAVPATVPAASPTPTPTPVPLPPPPPPPAQSAMSNATTNNQPATSVPLYGSPDLSGRVPQNDSKFISASNGAAKMTGQVNSQNVSIITVKGIASVSEDGTYHYLLSDGSIEKSKKKYRLNQLFAE